MLIALAQETLISAQASQQMKRLLRPLNRVTVEGATLDPYLGLASRIDLAMPQDRSRRDIFFKAGLFPSLPGDPPYTTVSEAGVFNLESPLGPSRVGVVVLDAASRLGNGGQRRQAAEDVLGRFVETATQKFGW
jgi:hypothetical protein